MSFFMDMLAHDGQMDFEKCGDVVVSPKDNKIALFCHFCKDLFTYLPEFLRHLQVAHGDVLHFTKEHHVYSVEELLSAGGTEDQEGEEIANSTQVGDVAEEPDDCEGTYNTPEIDLADEIDEPASGSGRDVLAEVEAMLLSDEEVVEEDQQGAHQDKTQDLAIKAYIEICQGLQEKKETTGKPIIKPISPKTIPESRETKGGRNRKGEGLKISHLKSHAIASQSRKRMSSVKKRILRAIDNFVPKKRVPLGREPDDQEQTEEQAESLELIPIRPKDLLSGTPARPPINPGHLSVRKSTLTTARISLQMTTTTSSETIVSCSNGGEASSCQSSSKTVVTTSNQKEETFCQENEVFNLPKIARIRKSTPIQVRKIEILPLLNLDKAKNEDDVDVDKELATLLGKRSGGLTIKPAERSALTENRNGSPRAKKALMKKKESPAEGKNSRTQIQKLTQDVQSYFTKHDDTNRSRLDASSVETEIDMLLARIDSRKKPPTNPVSSKVSAGQEEIEVLIDNCTLLKYVGLPVLHNPSYEDKIIIEELEDLRGKAAKFCEILREYDGIWNCRKSKPMANNLAALIETFTQEVNAAVGSNLSKIDIKRILNLITLWFWQTVDLKFFKKATLPPSTQHYFNLFAFIPQFTRFIFFCEYCDENFTLESAYKKHLMSHSITIRCAICRRVFKGHGFLDKHLRAHHSNVNVLEYI